MMNEKQANALLSFLEKYAELLQEIVADEKEKLAALVSNSLERIERSILTAQTNTKRIEGVEKKRTLILQENDCAGYTLTQMCEECPQEMRTRMELLCARVRTGVEEIKWNNDKAMGVARMNVIQINPDAVLTTIKHDAHPNPYQRAKSREQDADATQLLATKI